MAALSANKQHRKDLKDKQICDGKVWTSSTAGFFQMVRLPNETFILLWSLKMLRPYISQGMRQQKGAHETISKHSTQIMNSNCNLKVIKSNIIQLFSQKLILIYNLLLFYNICDFLLTFSHFSYPTLSLFKFSLFTLAFCEFLSLPIFLCCANVH